MVKLIFACVFLTVTVKSTYSQLSPPLVKTPLGFVLGRHIKSYEGRTAIAFEGIPYAKAPVGDLRFKEPQPIGKWSDTVIANKTYVCMQYTLAQPIRDVVGTEDCLYVNVYVPRETITGREDLDVVIHIHGGGYSVGDPKSFAAADYMVDREFVYVSITYRVGVLGFLSTQDAVQPGNAGLKDQVLAMKWVKNNIRSFGGNPASITLTGASAGAGAVHLHYLSPMSKGLFNRGFSQSGTALNMWNLSKNPVKQARRLGDMLGCKFSTSQVLVDCLRSKAAREVVFALSNFTRLANTLPSTPFGPVIEYGKNAFLPDHPYKLLMEGKINDVPWITSNSKDEGVVPLGFILLYGKLDELGNRWEELLPDVLDYEDSVEEYDKPFVARAIRHFYLRDESLKLKNIHNLLRMFTDRFFIVDGVKAVCLHSAVAQSPVYYYYFDYLIDMPISYKANLSVVAHGDDFRMLFRQYDNAPVLSESDRKMKNIFLDFIYRYATTGIPDFKGVQWKTFNTPQGISYMHITSPTLIRRNKLINTEPLQFWHNLPIKENEKSFSYSLNYEQFLPWTF